MTRIMGGLLLLVAAITLNFLLWHVGTGNYFALGIFIVIFLLNILLGIMGLGILLRQQSGK